MAREKIASREKLAEIKNKYAGNTLMRVVSEDFEKRSEVLVHMDDCGIKAGARQTLLTLVDEVTSAGLKQTSVMAVGCSGVCDLEPVVEIREPGKPSVRYQKVNAELAKEIVKEHLLGGRKIESALIKKD